jgi:hypothetical protein
LATAATFPGFYVSARPEEATVAELVPGELLQPLLRDNMAVQRAFAVARQRVADFLSRAETASGYLQPLFVFHQLAVERARLLGTAASRQHYDCTLSFVPLIAVKDYLALVGRLPLPTLEETRDLDKAASLQDLMALSEGLFGRSAYLAVDSETRLHFLEALCEIELQLMALCSLCVVSHDMALTEKHGCFNAMASRAELSDSRRRRALLLEKASPAPISLDAAAALPASWPLMRSNLVCGGDAGLVLLLRAARLLLSNPAVKRWLFNPSRVAAGSEGTAQASRPTSMSFGSFYSSLHERLHGALKAAHLETSGHEPMAGTPTGVSADMFRDFEHAWFEPALRALISVLEEHLADLPAGAILVGNEFDCDTYGNMEGDCELAPAVTISVVEVAFFALYLSGIRPGPPRYGVSLPPPFPPVTARFHLNLTGWSLPCHSDSLESSVRSSVAWSSQTHCM